MKNPTVKARITKISCRSEIRCMKNNNTSDALKQAMASATPTAACSGRCMYETPTVITVSASSVPKTTM